MTGVADLAKSGVKVALCQPQVPCGSTAEKVFANAKITVKPVTLEADVKSTLAKVESNEVDAGVVYVTDVRAAGSKVTGHHDPRGRERLNQISDRCAHQGTEPHGGQGVRGLRPIVRRPESADGRRIRAAVSTLEARAGAASRSRATGRRGAPALIAAPALVGFAFLLLPLIALLVRAPWHSMGRLLTQSTTLTALRLSVECASAATAISLLVGVPLAWVLARVNFPGRQVMRALVTLPLVLPPVVGGLALLLSLGRNGIFGRYLLSWFGVALPFTTAGVIVAETFVAMPFLVVTVEGALRSSDRDLEEAASTLRASRLTIFRRITIPLIGPSLLAGAALCWARALGEFGATITFAGNFPGTTQTGPLAVYQALEVDPEAAIALSLVLLTVAVIILAVLRDRLRGSPSQ